MTNEEKALQIINALAPLSRRDDWWSTDGPVAIVARELAALYRAETGLRKAWAADAAAYQLPKV